jgi:hypothetical protein
MAMMGVPAVFPTGTLPAEVVTRRRDTEEGHQGRRPCQRREADPTTIDREKSRGERGETSGGRDAVGRR